MSKRNTFYAAIGISLFLTIAIGCFSQEPEKQSYKSWSIFPILMYDSDIGVGYGGRAKFVDYLHKKESFDLILFNSSKGERWYVFTFSILDPEIRQGKKYGLSFDLKAEYDKYLNYSYYGIGADSKKDEETVYTFETKSVQLTFSRGFTPQFVVEVSYVVRNLNTFNIRENKTNTLLAETLKQEGNKFSPFFSIALRYDTSDSQIHPTRGFRLLFQTDVAANALGNNKASFSRITVDFRKYFLVFGAKDVLAFRALVQGISGSSIPLADYSVLGGGAIMNAMRGYKLNRFVDKGKFLFNAEYRFPIIWRLGGNLFVNTGTVWPSLSEIHFKAVAFDYGWGLRFYLPDFVARFDMGFSKEGTGIYFNFGHIF